MYFTGFADEASPDIDIQIKATKELGWSNIETRALCGGNLASISEEDFDAVCAKLDASGVSFNCYGSGIANWSQPVNEGPEKSYEEMKKAIPRMQKLGIKMARIMSFAIPAEIDPEDYTDAVFERLNTIVKMAEDGGILCLHENCMNWGGQSYEHTLRLLDAVKSPNFKLVYDTGNPVFSKDVRGEKPYKFQNSFEFYNNVKEFIHYIHIKDGRMIDEENKVFTFPGEGQGCVKEILTDMFKNGYDGGISIEPHMKFVFHEENQDRKEEQCYNNYIEYGKRMMKMVDDIKSEIA